VQVISRYLNICMFILFKMWVIFRYLSIQSIPDYLKCTSSISIIRFLHIFQNVQVHTYKFPDICILVYHSKYTSSTQVTEYVRISAHCSKLWVIYKYSNLHFSKYRSRHTRRIRSIEFIVQNTRVTLDLLILSNYIYYLLFVISYLLFSE